MVLRPDPEKAVERPGRTEPHRHVTPLSHGRAGAEGAVARLATHDSREIRKMMAMGVLPGMKIRLIQRFPSYVFQVGYSQFTVDRALAETIHVSWGPPATLAESPAKRA